MLIARVKCDVSGNTHTHPLLASIETAAHNERQTHHKYNQNMKHTFYALSHTHTHQEMTTFYFKLFSYKNPISLKP